MSLINDPRVLRQALPAAAGAANQGDGGGGAGAAAAAAAAASGSGDNNNNRAALLLGGGLAAGIAAGADGIIVEVHPEPTEALSDGPQALRFGMFEQLMNELRVLAPAVGRELPAAP